MKNTLLIMFLTQLFNFLKPETVRKFIDSGLIWLENKIVASGNQYDDTTVLPIIKLIRTTLSIPASTAQTGEVVVLTSKLTMISSLLSGLFGSISPEMLKGFIDAGLDVVENTVQNSVSTYDDLVVLPIVSLIRTSFDIPDNDLQLVTAELVK